MIGYVTFGTNDMARATAFYDALFAEIGIPRLMEFPNGLCWGPAMDKPALGVLRTFDGQPATAGNGTMVALVMDSTERVQQLHAKALALGGRNEGDPGPRGPGFYAAYFRDLDGNKLNAFCMTAG
ncbi:MAG: VOC family protein [Burkholderiales bacterium]|uniref:VOC family protein n=1 Tax=Inhella sp. TaxID=1921806 RepID=UPI001AD24477|nr:VOC family protein [Burkholderiales bacterium]